MSAGAGPAAARAGQGEVAGLASYVLVGPWGATSGPVPWGLLTPAQAADVLASQVPVFVRPIPPGPLSPSSFAYELVEQMNAARDQYIETLQDLLEKMGTQAEGIMVQVL